MSGFAAAPRKSFKKRWRLPISGVTELAALNVDLVLLQGALPCMLLGPEFDRENSRKLSDKHGVPVLSATMIQLGL